MALADGKDDGLADFAAHRIQQGVFQKYPAEETVGVRGEESVLKVPARVAFLAFVAGFLVGECDPETLLGEQLRSGVGAGVHYDGVDQHAVLYAVHQRVAEGGFAAGAAESAVGVQQQPAFLCARVICCRRCCRRAAQVVAGRCGQPQLVPHEIVKHGAGVAADGTVRFVRNHQVKIGRRKQIPVLVVEQQ